MTTIQHTIPSRNYCGGADLPRHKVTLPAIPGVQITLDRSDTAPRGGPITTAKRPPYGAALRMQQRAAMQARVDAIKAALTEDLE